MFEIKAELLVESTRILAWIHQRLDRDEFDKNELLSKFILTGLDNQPKLPFPEVFEVQFEHLQNHCKLLGADHKALFTQEVIAEIKKPDATLGKTLQRVDDLSESLRRELKLVSMYVLDKRLAEFMGPMDEQLYDVLYYTFPESLYDFVEARKCLAFERYTACALHLLRAQEPAIAKVGACIGVKPKDGTWGAMIGEIRIEIGLLDSGKAGRSWPSTTIRRQVHEAATHLRHIQIGERDPSFHGVTQKYSAEEARLKYENARSFMIFVATLSSPSQPA